MNTEEYKRQVSQKGVLDHTTLKVTLKEMVAREEFELAAEIKRILDNNQIIKPLVDSDPYTVSTTFYKVDLPVNNINRIVEILLELEVVNNSKDGGTTPTAFYYASIADKWNTLS